MKPVKTEELEIHTSELLKTSFILEAALHPLRQQMLLLLSDEPLTAASICRRLFLEEAICLQHLSILCGVGLLLREIENKHVFYVVNHAKLCLLHACAEKLLP